MVTCRTLYISSEKSRVSDLPFSPQPSRAAVRFFFGRASVCCVHRCAAEHVPICVRCVSIAVEVVEIQSAERGFGHGEKRRVRQQDFAVFAGEEAAVAAVLGREGIALKAVDRRNVFNDAPIGGVREFIFVNFAVGGVKGAFRTTYLPILKSVIYQSSGAV